MEPHRRNARKLSPVYATGIVERVAGENKSKGDRKEKRCKTESQQDE